MPKQAKIIADYMMYLVDFVIEINAPDQQMEKLEEIFRQMKKEGLPVNREEFESRAVLYHVLMDLYLRCFQRLSTFIPLPLVLWSIS